MPSIRISSPDELRRYLPQLHAAGIIAVRLETTGDDPHTDQIRSLLLAAKDGTTLTLDRETLNPNVLQELFATLAVKVFHDAKADLQFLLALGILPKPLFDASLATQLLYLPGDSDDYSFHALIRQYLGEDVNEHNAHKICSGFVKRWFRCSIKTALPKSPRLNFNVFGLSRISNITAYF